MQRGLDKILTDRKANIDLDKLLENYISAADERLDDMQSRLNSLIPLAECVRNKGMIIENVLNKGKNEIEKATYDIGLRDRMFGRGWKGKKPRDDFEHTVEAISVISNFDPTWYLTEPISRNSGH